ncbi:hypothetical protein GTQ40_04465 [Flavobacteriaceae bacterium R38]|nr:hypothetical protein [Flavobacteriaceae bacterium R38]
MDELELLKKDWQKNDKSMPKVSYDDISKMIWKKSSSIVKWIFYISIIELLFFIASNLYLSNDKEYLQRTTDMNLTGFTIITNIVAVLVLVYFMIKFYNNYKTISSTDNTKKLMENILNTRKTVKNYIKVSLSFGVIISLGMIVAMILYDESFKDAVEKVSDGENSTLVWAIIIILLLIVMIAAVLILWLFYQLFYGFLLRKLNRNYKELEKMEL